jgi:hypothetical protein
LFGLWGLCGLVFCGLEVGFGALESEKVCLCVAFYAQIIADIHQIFDEPVSMSFFYFGHYLSIV